MSSFILNTSWTFMPSQLGYPRNKMTGIKYRNEMWKNKLSFWRGNRCMYQRELVYKRETSRVLNYSSPNFLFSSFQFQICETREQNFLNSHLATILTAFKLSLLESVLVESVREVMCWTGIGMIETPPYAVVLFERPLLLLCVLTGLLLLFSRETLVEFGWESWFDKLFLLERLHQHQRFR